MRISIFGLGYVGCVTSACLARDGHEVIGIDVNPQKVAQINSGRPTVIEPNLDEFVAEAVEAGKLRATGDSFAAVQDTDLSLICVGTPSNGNGSLDRKYLKHVCAEIGAALAVKDAYHLVVVR
ncbi:MAG TPA: GDP-mannose dehydrogenase, partial [Anaerolineae bacterium]|nr:GDP-mannose dehydrogenase [Anaerolineae bacterium]